LSTFCLLTVLICTVVCRYVYSLEYGRTVNTLLAHDDAISQLSMQESLLVSSSWDSTVKVSYFTTHLWEFRQIYILGAVVDKDELVRYWDQKVRGQGHDETRCGQKSLV